jgi:hypothetical protein
MTIRQAAVEQAEGILNDLAAKRDAAIARRAAIAGQMRQSGYGALVEGSTISQKKLKELREELRDDSELVALDGAVGEAQARLAAARQRLDVEEERARLRAALEAGKALRDAGRKCSAHLDAFIEELGQVKAHALTVAAFGIRGVPRLEGLRVLLERSVQLGLYRGRLNQVAIDRPGQVRSVAGLIDHIVDGLEDSVARALQEPDHVAEPVADAAE